MCLQYKSFESTVEKGEIAHNEQFLPFPVFSTYLKHSLPSNLKFSSANSFSLEESKMLFWKRLSPLMPVPGSLYEHFLSIKTFIIMLNCLHLTTFSCSLLFLNSAVALILFFSICFRINSFQVR